MKMHLIPIAAVAFAITLSTQALALEKRMANYECQGNRKAVVTYTLSDNPSSAKIVLDGKVRILTNGDNADGFIWYKDDIYSIAIPENYSEENVSRVPGVQIRKQSIRMVKGEKVVVQHPIFTDCNPKALSAHR